MKYKIIVTDAEYETIQNDDSSTVLEWKEGTGDSSTVVETHDTVKEAFESMYKWGSKWIMYPSVIIENEDGEEVWASTLVRDKCKCCGHESYEQIENGLYGMKDKTGKLLFPDIV